jgi:hypothetical protein
MFRAFIRLAVGLAREPEFHQRGAHRVSTDGMPHLRQGRGKLLHAFRHPDQRPHGITQRRGLDQALKRGDQPRIVLANRATTATGTANPPLRQRLRFEILLAAIDRRPGEPGDLRDDRSRLDQPSAPPPPRRRPRRRTVSRPRPIAAEFRPRRSSDRLTPVRRKQGAPPLSQSDARHAIDDSVIVRSVLEHVPPRLNRGGFPFAGRCVSLTALIRFWETARWPRPIRQICASG